MPKDSSYETLKALLKLNSPFDFQRLDYNNRTQKLSISIEIYFAWIFLFSSLFSHPIRSYSDWAESFRIEL
jgi:hypothetical protein